MPLHKIATGTSHLMTSSKKGDITAHQHSSDVLVNHLLMSFCMVHLHHRMSSQAMLRWRSCTVRIDDEETSDVQVDETYYGTIAEKPLR